MTAHPLTPLLAPSSVAIFGASNDPTRISGRSLRYFREAGYKGGLYPINPTRDTVQGLKAFPDVAAVPGSVECAVIAVPANLAIEAMESCVVKGVKAVVMFTAGFAEIGPEGRAMQTRITEIARDGGIRLCGPNCLGLFNMRIGHTPTFSSFLEEGPTPAGPLGMVTQSGAFGTHLLALAARRGIQVGVWLSTGNEADVSVADGISFLADDPDTKAIACYVEAIKDGAAFAEAVARARANGKPVIAMKVGSSTVGAAAAASHTASLAGADAVYDAAFRQLAVERAKTPEDLINIAYACTRGRLPSSRRLAVMTMSGGAGVLMADASEEGGLDLTPLSDEAQKEVIGWVPFAAARNPVDVTAQVLERPVDPRQIVRPAVRQGKFPVDGGVLHDLGELAADGRAAVPGGQRRCGALSRPLFRAVGDRHPGDAAPLRGGRGRAVRGSLARRRNRSPPRHAPPSGSTPRRCQCRRCRKTCRPCRRDRSASTRRSASSPRPASRC